MSPELKTACLQLIANSPELTALADTGQDAALAAALSEALPKVPKPKTFLGERGIYDLLKVQEGEVFLQTVEALAAADTPMKSTFSRVDRWIKDPIGLDVGSIETQQQLQALVPTFSQSSVDKIIDFGSQKQNITIKEVSQLR